MWVLLVRWEKFTSLLHINERVNNCNFNIIGCMLSSGGSWNRNTGSGHDCQIFSTTIPRFFFFLLLYYVNTRIASLKNRRVCVFWKQQINKIVPVSTFYFAFSSSTVFYCSIPILQQSFYMSVWYFRVHCTVTYFSGCKHWVWNKYRENTGCTDEGFNKRFSKIPS